MANSILTDKDNLTFPSFRNTLKKHALKLERKPLTTIQVNIGKLCNQACSHCHVESGPTKLRENMNQETVNRLMELIDNYPSIQLVDITGGAPELNPHFKELVVFLRNKKIEVLDRCNLTVLFEPNQERLPEFLAEYGVNIVASLPCYTPENVNQQRGDGVFVKSISGLQKLNSFGFGKSNSHLKLDLVYNPVGAFLPPSQKDLEEDYKKRLMEDFDIEFNQLYTITNMPIKRFYRDLVRNSTLNQYMNLLADSFNSDALENVMCRSLVSISWDGKVYDCDFNQALEIKIPKNKHSIFDIESFDEVSSGAITLGDHCYACTAGSGSSCGGSLV